MTTDSPTMRRLQIDRVTLRRDELVAEATRHMAANARFMEFGDLPHLLADFAMMIAARVAVRMMPPPEVATLRARVARLEEALERLGSLEAFTLARPTNEEERARIDYARAALSAETP